MPWAAGTRHLQGPDAGAVAGTQATPGSALLRRRGYCVVVTLADARCGYRGGSGHRDGDPTEGVGLSPEDPGARWSCGEGRWTKAGVTLCGRHRGDLPALPVPGVSRVVDGSGA